MKKNDVIAGSIRLIKRVADKKKLTITNRGTGHAFDGSAWENLIADTSNIPNIIAKKDGYSIELRSFWGNPEIDIRRRRPYGEELLVLNFSDSVIDGNKIIHTGEFRVNEVRVDGTHNYKRAINDVYKIIDEICKK